MYVFELQHNLPRESFAVFEAISIIFYEISKSFGRYLSTKLEPCFFLFFLSLFYFCLFVKITTCLFSILDQTILMPRANPNGCFTMFCIFIHASLIFYDVTLHLFINKIGLQTTTMAIICKC
jgi:hypothetical protein